MEYKLDLSEGQQLRENEAAHRMSLYERLGPRPLEVLMRLGERQS